ncbi:MAG: CHASE2 domain-containing protein [Desulforhopalus sp.]
MNRETEGLRLLSDKRWSLQRTLLFSNILLTVFLSGIYHFQVKVIESINLKVTDIIFSTVEAPAPALDIVTVAIDEASLEKYGQWPWPRYRFARLLEKINAGGAESIGIDIIFAEQDRTSPQLWKENLENDLGYVIDTSAIPSEFLDNDAYLASILTKGPYVLGYTFLFTETATRRQNCTLHPVFIGDSRDDDAHRPASHFHPAEGVICNYELLGDAVTSSGFLNGTPDADGVLRRLPLLIEYGGTFYPSFSLAVLKRFRHQEPLIIQSEDTQIHRFSMMGSHIPIDEQGNFLLSPARTGKSKQYSATEVVEGQIDSDLFRGKIVLVGLTAAGLAPQYPTPLASATSLLDLHRYAIETLASELPTVRTQFFMVWETGLSLLLSFFFALCAAYLPVIWTIAFSLLAACSSWYAASEIFQNSGLLFSPLLPTVSVALGSCLVLTLRFYHFQQLAKAETDDTLLLLKSSETNLQSILKTIPDIVFRLDTRGKITFISPAISKYMESPASLLGRPIFELVAPEDRAKVHFRLNERRTGERATVDLEISLLLSREINGSEDTRRHFSLSAEGIYRPHDHPGSDRFLGTQGIIRDITTRKRLEYQLIQAQKMEVIGNLAAGIAHDLNNILSGLVSYPDLLLLEIPNTDPLYKKIQVIQRSGKKAAVIVQDLLTLARRGITIDEICNINFILSEYLDSAEFQLVKKRHPNVAIRTNLQENLLNIKGSAVHLSKVIMNILHNGLEAMPGGGEILISTSNIYIDTFLQGYENIPEGEYVCTSVSDSGVGISKDDINRIFEPFYTKKSMHLSGTGLGMTVIWATIKDHKGYLDIKSAEGQGTTFTFYLPTTRKSFTAQQPRIVLDDYIGSETILIVDDIAEQLDIARNMLAKLGYTVHTSSSGEKALEFIQQQPVDLVILDMIMPGGRDGLETYQEIMQLYPHQKAIITSGFSESERVRKLLQLGAGDYVPKPYTMEKLGMAVRKELNR